MHRFYTLWLGTRRVDQARIIASVIRMRLGLEVVMPSDGPRMKIVKVLIGHKGYSDVLEGAASVLDMSGEAIAAQPMRLRDIRIHADPSRPWQKVGRDLGYGCKVFLQEQVAVRSDTAKVSPWSRACPVGLHERPPGD